MKQITGTLLLFLILTCGAMAAPQKLFLGAGDTGTVVTLDQRTVAVIELWSNPSTGYGWRARQPIGNGIRIVGSEFESAQPGMLGAGGMERIYVVGASKGRTGLTLQYRPAWRQDADDSVKFTFNSVDQFKENFTLPSQEAQAVTPEARSSTTPDLGLPVAFNWCGQNGCTPVRNQGNCGSCWAFATVGPLESLIKINDGVTVDLSEQYLVSCNSEGWGCDGGFWAHDYHQWKMVSGEYEAGAVLEGGFPYQAADVACNPPHDKAYQIASWAYVCGSSNCTPTTDQLKQAIYNHGPLSVSVCVNTAFQNYTGGVFTGPGCTDLNHGVVLVGWDDADGCWIMRNSWGASWGESGYMRIKYGVSGIGSDASYVTYNAPPNPEPEPDENEITNGQTISNLSAAKNGWLYYYIAVPEGATNLQILISGGSGDADLYTRFGSQPTLSEYDCRPYRYGNTETCSQASPQAGKWYIGLHGYSAFSGVRLTASYDETAPEPEPDENQITNGQTISNLSAAKDEWIYYYIDVPEDTTNLQIQIFGGSGDADLYTRFGSLPTLSEYDCRPYRYGNSETCRQASPQTGKWYIGLHAFRAFSAVRLSAHLY
jgi:C1A family cysteine protease